MDRSPYLQELCPKDSLVRPFAALDWLLSALLPYAQSGTYMGDPPPGLSIRGAFFGWKSDKEVCGGVVSVVSESCSRRWWA